MRGAAAVAGPYCAGWTGTACATAGFVGWRRRLHRLAASVAPAAATAAASDDSLKPRESREGGRASGEVKVAPEPQMIKLAQVRCPPPLEKERSSAAGTSEQQCVST